MYDFISEGIKPPQVETMAQATGKALTLAALVQENRARQQEAQLKDLTIQETRRGIQEDQQLRDLFQKNPEPSAADIYSTVGAARGNTIVKAQREAAAAALDLKIKTATMNAAHAERLGVIASGIKDEPTFQRGIQTAIQEGALDPAHGKQLLDAGWNPSTQQEIQNFGAQGYKDVVAAHNDERAKAEEDRKRLLAGPLLAKATNEALTAGLGTAAQTVGQNANQDQYTAWRNGLPEEVQRQIPPFYSPAAVAMVQRQGMTAEQQARLDEQKAENIRKSMPSTAPELAFWLHDPKRTPEEITQGKAALKDLEAHAIASRPVINNNAAASGAGVLTDDDFKRAGTEYAITGVMPALGNGSGPVKQRLIHEKNEFARSSGLTPRDMALAGAAFKGDSKSLGAFQTQRDQIVSFEQTAQKNLDLMLDAGKKLIDTGSPLLNKPLRSINRSALGSDDQAAFDAAQLIAQNEVAKVTSGGGLGGVVSDTSQREMKKAMGDNPTIGNMIAVAKILKQDMANRHQSMDNALGAIRGRIGTFGSPPPEPGSSSGAQKNPFRK